MTNDEKQEMNRLCQALQQELDPAKFTHLLTELLNLLDGVLERKEQTAQPKTAKQN